MRQGRLRSNWSGGIQDTVSHPRADWSCGGCGMLNPYEASEADAEQRDQTGIYTCTGDVSRVFH